MTKKEAYDICRARQHAAWVRFCDEVAGSHPTEHYDARRLAYQAEYDAAIAEWTVIMDGPRSDK
jgi:hypothetical protein